MRGKYFRRMGSDSNNGIITVFNMNKITALA